MRDEDKLNFPIFKDAPSPPSIRSMDEINDWIAHDFQFVFDRKLYEKKKKQLSVNVPFKL